MMIGLVLAYAIPFVSDFLQFVDPSLTTALLVIAASLVSIAGIEVVRFVHRRAVAKMVATSAPALVARVGAPAAPINVAASVSDPASDGRTPPMVPPTAPG
jgi:cation-transporting ATPase E